MDPVIPTAAFALGYLLYRLGLPPQRFFANGEAVFNDDFRFGFRKRVSFHGIT